MNNDILLMPGYEVWQYLLVIQPHDELQTRIYNIKNEFAKAYEVPLTTTGKPSIVIARFSQLALMEERLKNRLCNIATALPAIKLDLSNFGSIPTHSIYINVVTQAALQMVSKHLKTARPLLTTKQHKPFFTDNFLITIARQLLPWQFEKGWQEYCHKHFTASFIAKNMLLLRRANSLTPYQPVASFAFLNMPVVTKQGALF